MLAAHFLSTSVLFATHLIPAGELSHFLAAVEVAGKSRYHLMDDSCCLLYNCWRTSYWNNRCVDNHPWLRLWMELHLSRRGHHRWHWLALHLSRMHHRLHWLALHRLTLVLRISNILLLLLWIGAIVLHLILYSSIQFIINKLEN